MIREISKKLSLTETEVKVLLFLLLIFAAGAAAKYLLLPEKIAQYQEFDYSQEDSLFVMLGKQEAGAKKPVKGNNTAIVDSEREVLDFNKGNFKESQSFKFYSQKKVNINKAGINELIALPGIGEKTAINIVEYRNSHGSFNRPEDLLNIHGIGSSKLKKLKEYIVFNQQADSTKK
jgi:competence protein ComEA